MDHFGKQRKSIYTAAAVLVLCLTAGLTLWGCGNAGLSVSDGQSGGGQIISGVGIGGTGVVKTSLAPSPSGVCNLIGAVVFLDLNNNRLPDPSEPFTYTDQNGKYTLQASDADLAAYPLLLQAIVGVTIDKATGQPVADGYVGILNQ